MNIETQTKHIIETYNTEALFELKGKTEPQIIVEKFLILQIEKTKEVMRSLAFLLTKRTSHWKILRFAPLVCLVGFFLPPGTFSFLCQADDLSRFVLWIAFNIALIPFGAKRKKMKALKIILTFFAAFALPQQDLNYIFNMSGIGAMFVFQTLFALFSALAWRRLDKQEKKGDLHINKEIEDEIFNAAQDALDVAEKLKGEALRETLEKYAPELDVLISRLKLREPETDIVRKQKENKREEKKDGLSESPDGMILPIYLGKKIERIRGIEKREKNIYIDLARETHIGIYGQTDSGKSNTVKVIINGYLEQGDIDLVLVDCQKVELAYFDKFSAVRFYNRKNAEEAFSYVQNEQERRQKLFLEKEVENITKYNNKTSIKMRRLVMVVDEFSLLRNKKDLIEQMIDTATTARKYGINLIFITQYPTKENVDSTIKACLSTTLAFSVKSAINARVIETPGAEKLDEQGVFYYVRASKQILIKAPIAKDHDKVRAKKKNQVKRNERQLPQVDTNTHLDAYIVQKSPPPSTQIQQLPSRHPSTNTCLIQVSKMGKGVKYYTYGDLKKELGYDPILGGYKSGKPSHDGKQVRGFLIKRIKMRKL